MNQSTPASQAPAASSSFSATKSFDTETSLQILKAFYQEVRKEIKKISTSVVTASTEEDCTSLLFVCDGFNLSFNYTEGGAK